VCCQTYRIVNLTDFWAVRTKFENAQAVATSKRWRQYRTLPACLRRPKIHGVGQASFRMKDARAYHLKLYNLTITEWDIIDAFQNHVCAICHQPNKSGQRLSTDHSHLTGIIRGLLCQRCNRILGKIEDPRFWRENTIILLRAAADFLEHFPAVIALGREIFTYPGKFGTKAHRDWIRKNRGVSGASFRGTNDHTTPKRRAETHVKVPRLCTVGRRL
jgi:Recombination endonuclease VII